MTKWGDLESEEEESEEEEEEEEPEEDTESLADGIASSLASGYNSSLPSGIETPEVIDLRKGKAGGPLSCLASCSCSSCALSLNLLGMPVSRLLVRFQWPVMIPCNAAASHVMLNAAVRES